MKSSLKGNVCIHTHRYLYIDRHEYDYMCAGTYMYVDIYVLYMCVFFCLSKSDHLFQQLDSYN